MMSVFSWMSDNRTETARVLFVQAALVAAVLALWQFAPDLVHFDELLMSKPSSIAERTIQWIGSGILLTQGLATLKVVAGGLLFGGIVGFLVGLCAGLIPPVERMVEPVISAFFALPKSSLVPLFILWFGISTKQHIIFASLIVFFFFFFSTVQGIRSVPKSLNDMLSIIGASPFQKFYLLYLPASFKWLLTGARLALPHAFTGAISAEIIASFDGLGYLVKANAGIMDAAGMFSAIFFLLAMSVLISSTALFLGRRLQTRFNL